MDDRVWTIVTDNPIVLDFSKCKYYSTLHEIIQKAFGFPAYYGKNLSALWDCMRDFASDTNVETEVQIIGWGELPKDLQEYFHKVMGVFSDVHTKYPHMNFIVKS